MKIRFKYPKIEIIHTYYNKDDESINTGIFYGIRKYFNDYPQKIVLCILWIVTIALSIFTYNIKPEKHLYNCKIINIFYAQDNEHNTIGHFEYNGYRFSTTINKTDELYLKKTNAKYLLLKTSEDCIKDEIVLYDILLIISIFFGINAIALNIVNFLDN